MSPWPMLHSLWLGTGSSSPPRPSLLTVRPLLLQSLSAPPLRQSQAAPPLQQSEAPLPLWESQAPPAQQSQAPLNHLDRLLGSAAPSDLNLPPKSFSLWGTGLVLGGPRPSGKLPALNYRKNEHINIRATHAALPCLAQICAVTIRRMF